MEQEVFQVGDVRLNPGSVQRDTYQGIHSGKILSSLEIRVTTQTPAQTEQIEKLLTNERVLISDPVQHRSFEASIALRTSSYQQGRPERRYVIGAREVDLPPTVEALEIDGERFAVSEYRETRERDDQVGRHALLHLTEQDVRRLRPLVKAGKIAVKRIGVDESPLMLRFGSALYWSTHEENGTTVYRHIVRFYPEELEPSKVTFASAVTERNTAFLAMELAAKFNELIRELAGNGALRAEVASRLRIDPTSGRLDDAVVREWDWRFEKVSDASAHL